MGAEVFERVSPELQEFGKMTGNLMTTREVAEHFRVSVEMVRQWVHEGRLSLGSHTFRFYSGDVERFVTAARMHKSTNEKRPAELAGHM
jgi:excisionase family DNA binding protein